MKIQLKKLEKLFSNAAKKFVSEDEADYFATEVVETDIRKPSHKKYDEDIIKDIKSWEGSSAEIKKTIDLPGYTQYNFNGLGPSLKIKEIHDELEKKAKVNGVAMVSIINSRGMHKMHLWTQGLAKRDLFALASWNGGPDAVVPIGGTKGLLGTNPLTYGFPSDTGNVVVDMATSEIPYFKIVEAKKNGTLLPPNTAVDNSGKITTDPKKALDDNGVSNLLPMGGNYKGYNTNYLLEIMTSALIGARSSSEMSDDYIETEHGGFIIAIAIGKVTDKKKYDVSMKSTNEEIRAQKPVEGQEKVIVPGDTNLNRFFKISGKSHIEVDSDFVKVLGSLGSKESTRLAPSHM